MNKHFRFSGSTFSRLEKLGVSASGILRRAGLSQTLVNQPRVLLSTEELLALWQAIGEVSNVAGALAFASDRKRRSNASTRSVPRDAARKRVS